MTRISRAATAIAVALSIAAVTGCTAASSRPSSKELSIATALSTFNFDPYQADGGPSILAMQPAYETLITKNSDGSYKPGLADSYKYLSPTTFQFTVRPGVTFSDGAPLDAAAVVANLNRIKTVAGPEVAKAGQIASIEATDNKTVLLTLSSPNPALEDLLSHNVGMMVSPGALTQPSLATEPAGTGPYVLDKSGTVSGDHWTFVRNAKYWGDASAFPYDSLVFKSITDSTATLNALRAGTIGVAVGETTTAAAAKSAGLTVTSQATDSWGIVLADREGKKQPALGDVRVRQALNYAIDRKAIAKAVIGDYGTVATQWFGTQTDGHSKALEDAYPFDPEKAKKLLAEAGYADGFDLAVTIAPVHPAMVQAVQGYLAEIGVKLTIDNSGSFFTDVQAAKNPAYSLTYTMGDLYPVVGTIIAPTGALNPFHSSDSRINELYAQAASQPDAAARAADYQEIAQRISDQAWFLPVYYADAIVFSSKTVKVEQWSGEGIPWLYGLKPTS